MLIIAGSSDLNEEDYRSFLPLPGAGGQIQLWQFLLELLDCPDKFKDIIVWEGDQHYFDDWLRETLIFSIQDFL